MSTGGPTTIRVSLREMANRAAARLDGWAVHATRPCHQNGQP